MPAMGSNRFALDCLAFSSESVNTWTAQQLAQSAALVDRHQRRNANSFYLRSQRNESLRPSFRYAPCTFLSLILALEYPILNESIVNSRFPDQLNKISLNKKPF